MASAQDNASSPEPTWQHDEFVIEWDGRYSKERQANPSHGEFIYTAVPGASGNVALICFDGKLTAAISTDENPVEAKAPAAWNGHKTSFLRPNLKVNGKQVRSYEWVYQKGQGLLLPLKPSISRKFYNAAIRGDEIKLKADAKGKFTPFLPKPNAAFADFGAACGLGRKKDAVNNSE